MNSSHIERKVRTLERMASDLDVVVKGLTKLGEVDPDSKAKVSFSAPPEMEIGMTTYFNRHPRGDQSKFSFAKFIAGMIGTKTLGFERSWERFPYEKSVMEKAMGEGTGAAGGFLVPAVYVQELIELVRAKAAIRAAGARTMPVNSSNGYIPRESGAATASWLAEAATIPASDLTFEQVAFNVRKLAAYAILSNELLNDSSPAVEQIVRDDLAAAIALKEDYTALYGTGTAPEPRGIKNTAGMTLSSLGANGATPTFDNLIDLEAILRTNNRAATGWIVNPRSVTTFRKIKDAQNRYIWEPAPYTGYAVPSLVPGDRQAPDVPANVPGVSASQSGLVLGVPMFATTQIPINLTQGTSVDASDVFVGQWNELLIVERGGLELALSDQILFQNYQTAIRAIVRRDFVVRHASAFAALIGVRP